MGDSDYFAEGAWNVSCMQCERKIKSFEARHQWDGLIVCGTCYDPRHSQDFIRGRRDRQSIPHPRPDPTPIFVDE
jgi:hypothetical protein